MLLHVVGCTARHRQTTSFIDLSTEAGILLGGNGYLHTVYNDSIWSLIAAATGCQAIFFQEFKFVSKYVRLQVCHLPRELAQKLRLALLKGLVDAVVKIFLLVGRCADSVLWHIKRVEHLEQDERMDGWYSIAAFCRSVGGYSGLGGQVWSSLYSLSMTQSHMLRAGHLPKLRLKINKARMVCCRMQVKVFVLISSRCVYWCYVQVMLNSFPFLVPDLLYLVWWLHKYRLCCILSYLILVCTFNF